MDLYLIRHGESTANRDHVHAAWLPMPLTENGVQQAQQVGKFLKNIPFDRFYCSDVLRTVQTFDHAFGVDQTREYSTLLREANSGEFAGKAFAKCLEDFGEEYTRIRETWAFDLKGGESAETLIGRGAAFLRQMEALPEDVKYVAAVSHGGLMLAIAAHLMHQPMCRFPMLISNCGVCVLRLDREKNQWRIVHWNVGGKLLQNNATDGH